MVPNKDYYDCPLCSRKHSKDNMTWHHLIPKNGCQERQEPTVYICLTCHTVVHYCHTNKELCETYNTIDAIKQSKDVIDMVELYKYKAEDCIFKIKKLKKKKR